MRIGPIRTAAPGCTDLQSTGWNTTSKMIPKASRLRIVAGLDALKVSYREVP